MEQLNTLALICAFIAAHFALVFVICALGDVKSSAQANNLQYRGVLFVGKNGTPVDCYRHTGTNAVYYKIGVQWRNADNGRIVSTANALQGAY